MVSGSIVPCKLLEIRNLRITCTKKTSMQIFGRQDRSRRIVGICGLSTRRLRSSFARFGRTFGVNSYSISVMDAAVFPVNRLTLSVANAFIPPAEY